MGCWERTWRTDSHIWKRSVLCVLCYETKAEENTWNIEAGVWGEEMFATAADEIWARFVKGPRRSATSASGNLRTMPWSSNLMATELGRGLLGVRNPGPAPLEHTWSHSALHLPWGRRIPEAPTRSMCQAGSTSACDVFGFAAYTQNRTTSLPTC